MARVSGSPPSGRMGRPRAIVIKILGPLVDDGAHYSAFDCAELKLLYERSGHTETVDPDDIPKAL